MTREEKLARYKALCHAMQSGVRMEMGRGIIGAIKGTHLGVGVNMVKCDHAALVALLVKKGVISEEDYLDAIIESMECEVRSYEKRQAKYFGKKITLA